MIFFMPKSQDGLDKWSWVHLIGGILIAGISAIWLRPFWAFAVAVFCAVLYECRDALYASVISDISVHHKKILGRRLGAHYVGKGNLFALIFWMADPRGASKWDIWLTIGGGFVCAPLSHYLFAWLSWLLHA